MPSLATLAGTAYQNPNPDEEQQPGIVKPTNAVDAGTAEQGVNVNSAQVLPPGNPGSAADANSLPGGASAPPGIGDILKKGFDASNILGTVTPLATGLIGLLGNQQSTDALKKGAADATKTIQDGNTNIQGLLKSIYGEQSDILKPYQAVGQQGLDGISAGLQPGGGLVDGYYGATQFTRDPNFTRNTDNANTGQFNRATDFTDPTKFSFSAADLANDPGMKFRMDEQNKLLARRQASSGSLSSGAALKAAADYSGHLADQEFGTAYSRAEGTFNNNYGRADKQFADNYGRDATQHQQNFQNNDQVFNENYGRANAQFADNYNRDATTFGNNFNRGLAEQQSNQQQKMQALMNAAGIGQSASNTLVGAKGQQGQESATTQQLTNSQTADLQTSLASAIAAGDTTRANQIQGIISGTLGAVQSASDAARAQANQKPGDTINVQGGAGGAGGTAQGGAGGTVGDVAGGSVGDVSADTGAITNTQGDQTQGDQTNTQGSQTNTQGNQEGADVQVRGYGGAGVDNGDGTITMPDGSVIDEHGNKVQTKESTTGKVLDVAKTGVGLLKDVLTKGAGTAAASAGIAEGAASIGTAAAGPAIGSAAAAAGASSADAAAASAVASGSAGGGSLAALGSFLTNPITIGVGAALAGALIWKKSQAHPTADKFIKDSQGPFGEHLGNVVDGFDNALATGKLDKTTAQGLYDQTKSFIDGFESDRATLEAKGGKSAEVARNAKATMLKNFGPNYDKILGKIQGEIAQLPDPAGGTNHAAVMPRTATQQLAQIAGAA